MSNKVILMVAAAVLASTGTARAFTIYNKADGPVEAQVSKGDFKKGNFTGTVAPGDSGSCHFSNKSCNPDGGQKSLLTVHLRIGGFHCEMPLYAGGYAVIYAKSRPRTPASYPPAYQCLSRWDFEGGDKVLNEVPPGLDDTRRSVHFLGTGDPQYRNSDKEWNRRSDITATALRQHLKGDVRGIVIAGDLTMNTRRFDEYQWYKDSFSGRRPWIFDGLGNHDYSRPDGNQKAACDLGTIACVDPDIIRQDVYNTQRVTPKTNGQNPHYSWDWHDVHFVQLNLFASDRTVTIDDDGDSLGDAKYDPYNSLSFLANDLARFVGNSGRPVVITMHWIPGDPHDMWPTKDGSMVLLWDTVARYNVLAFLVGHAHCDTDKQIDQPTCWKRPWSKPDGAKADRSIWVPNGRKDYPVYVLGGAMWGWWSDIKITEDTFTIERLNAVDNDYLMPKDFTESFSIAPSVKPAVTETALTPGQVVALYNPAQGRFMRFQPGSACKIVDSSQPRSIGDLPDDFIAERFRVFDGGNGQVALYNETNKCFLRITSGGAVDSGGAHERDLPSHFQLERFQAIDVGNGQVAFYSLPTKRFMRLRNDGVADAGGLTLTPSLPNGWTWERFQVVPVSGSPIKSENGKCLDIAGDAYGRKENGATIQSWECNADSPQNWHWEGQHLVSDSGMCLDVDAGPYDKRTAGAKVQLWDCGGMPSQNWRWDGKRLIAGNGMCLDLDAVAYNGKTNGGKVQLWGCHDGPNQKWSNAPAVVPTQPASPPRSKPLVTEHIMCLDVGAGGYDQRTPGAKVQLWECNGGPNQNWRWDGKRLIADNDLCLDLDLIAYNSKANGGKIQLWGCHGGPNQNWHWDGKRLMSDNGKCLDIDRGHYDQKMNGGKLQAYDCNGGPNQNFSGAAP